MKRNLWPWAIITYFIVFTGGVVTWIVFAVHHQDQLVRPDYYEQEITYQKQIDTVARTSAVQSQIGMTYRPTEQTLVLRLPASVSRPVLGRIRLYRPSDAKLDRDLPVALDKDQSQTVNLSSMQAGFWKVHVTWTADDHEYCFEKPLVIATR
jgi:hypothetical protein